MPMKLHDLNAHATQLFPYLLRPKSPHTGNTWRGDKFNSEHDAVTLFFEKVPVVGRRDGRPCPARGANGERRWRGQYSMPRTEDRDLPAGRGCEGCCATRLDSP